MPTVSRAQQKLMFAAKKDPKLRKKKGIAKKVADEFVAADKARGPKKLPEKVGGKPKQRDSAAAREFRLRNAKL